MYGFSIRSYTIVHESTLLNKIMQLHNCQICQSLSAGNAQTSPQYILSMLRYSYIVKLYVPRIELQCQRDSLTYALVKTLDTMSLRRKLSRILDRSSINRMCIYSRSAILTFHLTTVVTPSYSALIQVALGCISLHSDDNQVHSSFY